MSACHHAANEDVSPVQDTWGRTGVTGSTGRDGRGPRNVIVIGVPRSGTSLTTAVFARKGYYVGQIEDERVRGGDDDNPFGYFEADDVIARNAALFQRVGFADNNTWLREMISDEAIAQLTRLEPTADDRQFVQRYNQKSPWIWKDPRLTLTLAYWWKLMDPARTRVVVVRRDIDEICRSFVRMGWYDRSDASRAEIVRRVERHLGAAEEALATLGIPHLVVWYRDFLGEPDRTASRLGEFVGLELTAGDLEVRPDLNHSTRRGRVSAWLRTQLDRGPLGHVRILKPLLPRRLLAWLLPEKKYNPRPS